MSVVEVAPADVNDCAFHPLLLKVQGPSLRPALRRLPEGRRVKNPVIGGVEKRSKNGWSAQGGFEESLSRWAGPFAGTFCWAKTFLEALCHVRSFCEPLVRAQGRAAMERRAVRLGGTPRPTTGRPRLSRPPPRWRLSQLGGRAGARPSPGDGRRWNAAPTDSYLCSIPTSV